MKIIAPASIGLALALTACAPAEDGPSVVDTLIGKTLTTDAGTVFVFNSDGTVGGMFRGEEVVGTYDANGKEVCSIYTAPELLTGREYCSVPEIVDNTVIFNRRDGSQSGLYTITE